MSNLLNYISNKLEFRVNNNRILSGGDISEVFLLETSNGDFVLKVHEKSKFKMFQTEAEGLKLLKKGSSLIRVPEIYDIDVFEEKSYLLMEYIEPGISHSKSFEILGEGLAEIHTNTQEKFGANDSNFIGSLPQSNHLKDSWSEFYWEERINPQLKLAVEMGYYKTDELPKRENALKVFNELFINHRPALLHGDLWHGNYFFDVDGYPVFIDPSVYFGHPAMDIGMSKLFGGFDEKFFKAYKIYSDLGENIENQIKLAQLYYLLVHLILFGTGYLNSVNNIINQYLK